MKSVIFDLDNTLYPEIEYVKSGFRYVSSYLNSKYDLDEEEIFSQLMSIFEKNGRGKIFDILLKRLGLFSEENIHLLVYLYRSHNPEIKLYNGVLYVFSKLRESNYQIGMITDGRASVQKNKVKALDLEQYVDIIIYTDKLGAEYWKPSITPYKIALELLNSLPEESFYVGDDPYKDFLGPRNIGMKTIQIKISKEENYWALKGYEKTEADFVAENLNDLLALIKK